MNILIGGDLVPTSSNEHIFSNGDVEKLLGKDLYSIWRNSDIRIFNLEVPLTDVESPISKCGANLIAPTSTIKGIKVLNPTLITLANNHILDHGECGLKSTEDILNKFDIPFIGAGNNIVSASKPYIIQKGDKKIGIYACAENEFTIATEDSCGANPFDPLESLDHIANLKKECDYAIVLYHGGKEHYRYPSPYLQRVCRKMVEKGADLIVCQHSHCIGCVEKYNDSTIIYGQGNFIFDNCDNEYWNTSILIDVTFDKDIKINYVPICKDKNKVRLANKEEEIEILEALKNRSVEILDSSFLKEKYSLFALENRFNYLRKFAGYNRITAKIDYILKGKLLGARYNKNKLLSLENFINCEAHRELLLEGIRHGRKD